MIILEDSGFTTGERCTFCLGKRGWLTYTSRTWRWVPLGNEIIRCAKSSMRRVCMFSDNKIYTAFLSRSVHRTQEVLMYATDIDQTHPLPTVFWLALVGLTTCRRGSMIHPGWCVPSLPTLASAWYKSKISMIHITCAFCKQYRWSR